LQRFKGASPDDGESPASFAIVFTATMIKKKQRRARPGPFRIENTKTGEVLSLRHELQNRQQQEQMTSSSRSFVLHRHTICGPLSELEQCFYNQNQLPSAASAAAGHFDASKVIRVVPRVYRPTYCLA
jgi:hypothetical protein